MKISELPKAIKTIALQRQKNETDTYLDKNTEILGNAFESSRTEENYTYWQELKYKGLQVQEPITEPKHYDNSKGSLYKFCEDQELNTYEFDIIKRVMRCRKKGLFLEDLEKTKFAINLYIKEQLEKNK